jgi:hypothetical protein
MSIGDRSGPWLPQQNVVKSHDAGSPTGFEERALRVILIQILFGRRPSCRSLVEIDGQTRSYGLVCITGNSEVIPLCPRSPVLGKFVEVLAHYVFRYRFRRLRTSDGLCVVHLPVPRVTSRLSDGRGSANKVEFLLSKPVQIVFG